MYFLWNYTCPLCKACADKAEKCCITSAETLQVDEEIICSYCEKAIESAESR
jgi:hypothetical protein